jgi:predicted kinase
MNDLTGARLRPKDPSGGTFLLQMAGRSGAGKSTVAEQIAAHTGAVVVDMDILKSTALDVGVEWDLAGKVAYRGSWSVAEALLGQGFNVILDSPCRFEWIVNETTAIAQRQSAAYCFIECVMPDLEELGRRLRSRPRRRSQMVDAGVSSPDAPAMSGIVKQLQTADASVWDTKYPTSPWLQLDTRENAERCLARALAYLDQRRE